MPDRDGDRDARGLPRDRSSNRERERVFKLIGGRIRPCTLSVCLTLEKWCPRGSCYAIRNGSLRVLLERQGAIVVPRRSTLENIYYMQAYMRIAHKTNSLTRMRARARTHARTYTRAHTHTHTHTHARTHTHTHTHTQYWTQQITCKPTRSVEPTSVLIDSSHSHSLCVKPTSLIQPVNVYDVPESHLFWPPFRINHK